MVGKKNNTLGDLMLLLGLEKLPAVCSLQSRHRYAACESSLDHPIAI
jgi:hypothetical protein